MSVLVELKIALEDWLRENNGRLWDAIQDVSEKQPEFTVAMVLDQMQIRSKTAILRKHFDFLVHEGNLEYVLPLPDLPLAPIFRVKKVPQVSPELKAASAQQAMWNILRGPQARGGITTLDLAMLASNDVVVVTKSEAKKYLASLYLAKIVDLHGRRNRQEIYKVPPRKNTGPIAPKLLRVEFVYDPNFRASTLNVAIAKEVLK